MKQNNVITAPQLKDVDSAYKSWRESHSGSLHDFYTFMTTPSPDRDSFVLSLGIGLEPMGQTTGLYTGQA